MKQTKIPDCKGEVLQFTDKDEWLEARKGSLGCSEIGILFGCDPFRDERDLYKRLVDGDSKPVGRAAFWGTTLEPIMCDVMAEENVVTYLDIAPHTIIRHPSLPMHYSPDRLISHWLRGKQRRLLEIKCTSQTALWKDGIPRHVMYQVQGGHSVMGLSWRDSVVYALLGGTSDTYWEIDRDPEMIEQIEDKVKSFFDNHVNPKIPPPEPEIPEQVKLPDEADKWAGLRLETDRPMQCATCTGEGEVKSRQNAKELVQCSTCEGVGQIGRLKVKSQHDKANKELKTLMGDAMRGVTPEGIEITKDKRGAIKVTKTLEAEELEY